MVASIAKYVAITICVVALFAYLAVTHIQNEESWRLRYCIEQTGEPCPVAMER